MKKTFFFLIKINPVKDCCWKSHSLQAFHAGMDGRTKSKLMAVFLNRKESNLQGESCDKAGQSASSYNTSFCTALSPKLLSQQEVVSNIHWALGAPRVSKPRVTTTTWPDIAIYSGTGKGRGWKPVTGDFQACCRWMSLLFPTSPSWRMFSELADFIV